MLDNQHLIATVANFVRKDTQKAVDVKSNEEDRRPKLV